MINLALTYTHDYGPVHAGLFGLAARRVSVRIWLAAVAHPAGEAVFTSIGRALAEGDEMLVVELPRHMHPTRMIQVAA